jgi:hypothetical protein
MLKKIILKADLLTINKDVLQTSFIQQHTIMALGRGEFTDSEGRNCFIIPNKQLKYTV